MNPSRPFLPDAAPRAERRSAFSLIELLVVIAIMGILAGLLVGLAPAALKGAREARVRTEMRAIEAAIEGYKARHGVYPPDGLVLDGTVPRRDANGNLQVRPELSPLYYELSGMVVNNPTDPNGYFVPLGDTASTGLKSSDLRPYFGRDGFVNATTADRRRSLSRVEFKESAYADIFVAPGNPEIRVLAVGWAGDARRPGQRGGLPWPRNDARFPPPVPSNPQLNPWRYVSSNPTNNPGRFDLWAEYVEGNQKKVISNWRN